MRCADGSASPRSCRLSSRLKKGWVIAFIKAPANPVGWVLQQEECILNILKYWSPTQMRPLLWQMELQETSWALSAPICTGNVARRDFTCYRTVVAVCYKSQTHE